jgi:hypothetical protein
VELETKRVAEILKRKGVTALYHANTVQTACTFLRNGRLMARGVVEERGFVQTPQASDESDRKHGIWYDIFVDTFDIHETLLRINVYGPVLFVLDIESLLKIPPSVWVTKSNPAHWGKGSDRYFVSIDEFQDGYRKSDTRRQFMLRHIGGVLRLADHLNKIVLDDPGVTVNETRAYDQALGALKASARVGLLADVAVERRQCKSKCGCAAQYKSMGEKRFSHFFEP